MGLLNQQFAASPAAANQSALQWGAVGTGLQAGGQLSAGFGGMQNYLYRSALARSSAGIADQNAQAALRSGDYSAESSAMRYGALASSQRTGAAASGVDAGSGSAAAVQASTRTIGAMDAAMIHYNAAREAYGDKVQAANLKAQAGADTLGAVGAMTGGVMGAGASILGGASSLSQKWAQFQQLSRPANAQAGG